MIINLNINQRNYANQRKKNIRKHLSYSKNLWDIKCLMCKETVLKNGEKMMQEKNWKYSHRNHLVKD